MAPPPVRPPGSSGLFRQLIQLLGGSGDDSASFKSMAKTVLAGIVVLLAIYWFVDRFINRRSRTAAAATSVTAAPVTHAPPATAAPRMPAVTGATSVAADSTRGGESKSSLDSFAAAAHANPSAPVVWSAQAIAAATEAGCPASKFAAVRELEAAADAAEAASSVAANEPIRALPAITLTELRRYSGAEPVHPIGAAANATAPVRLRYVAVSGFVYDVTNSVTAPATAIGSAPATASTEESESRRVFDSLTGYDASRVLATGSKLASDLNLSMDGLPFHAIKRLEAIRQYMDTRFNRVATLSVAPQPGAAATASPTTESLQSKPSAAVDGASLHAAIDADDTAAVRRILSGSGAAANGVINSECARTRLTPLHKAIEKGDIALCRVLLEYGPNLSARAMLYDDETPLDMAKRFQLTELLPLLAATAAPANIFQSAAPPPPPAASSALTQ